MRGWFGLSAALLLAREGHDVTVLERDDDPVPATPDAAWQDWDRRGIFRAMMEIISMQALPRDVLARPGFAERVMAAANGREAPAPPGPSRDDLLRALA